jgi:hypothetical protein
MDTDSKNSRQDWDENNIPWRAWGSWFSWGSPVGMGLGCALVGLGLVCLGVFAYLIHLAGII